MILLDTSEYKYLPLNIKPLYMSLFEAELTNMINSKNLGFTQVLQHYSIPEIRNAFSSSFLENGYLTVDSKSNYDLIIRLLEFGGQGIKPSHFVSNIKSLFDNIFRKENSI